MKQIIRFTARFALEDYEDRRFYTLHSGAREYGSIFDCWAFEIGLPGMMQKRADEANEFWEGDLSVDRPRHNLLTRIAGRVPQLRDTGG